MKYYYTPKLGTDLSDGFEDFRRLDETKDEHIDSLLETIMDLEQRTGQKCEADVITWRGMMTRVRPLCSSSMPLLK